MRTEGTLRNWNDDRGFGFVVTSETKQDVFVHISSFPQTGRRPQAGERLAFSIETDHDGKKRAVGVSFLDPPSAVALAAMRNAPQVASTPRPANAASRHARRPRADRHGSERHARSREGAFGRLGGLAILLASVGAIAAILQRDAIETYLPSPATPTAAAPTASSFSPPTDHGFRCDGRTHCSQMTSCAEARYFLRNCPNVQMDGNHDGDPCEQQWCY